MWERLVTKCSVFWRIDDSRSKNLQEKETNHFRLFFDTARLKKSCRRGRLEAAGGTNGGHAVDGGSR